MKYAKCIIFLIGILLINGALMAQPLPGPKHGPRLDKMLDLSEEQQNKMQDMRLEMKKELLPLHTKLHSLQTDLKLAMTSEKFDEGEVSRIVEKMQKVRTEIQLKRIRHKRAVRDMLTAEQRKKFDLHILSEKGPGGHGMKPPKLQHFPPPPPQM